MVICFLPKLKRGNCFFFLLRDNNDTLSSMNSGGHMVALEFGHRIVILTCSKHLRFWASSHIPWLHNTEPEGSSPDPFKRNKLFLWSLNSPTAEQECFPFLYPLQEILFKIKGDVRNVKGTVLLYLVTNQLSVFRESDFPKPLQTLNHLPGFHRDKDPKPKPTIFKQDWWS